jgi:hypothetical protein
LRIEKRPALFRFSRIPLRELLGIEKRPTLFPILKGLFESAWKLRAVKIILGLQDALRALEVRVVDRLIFKNSPQKSS